VLLSHPRPARMRRPVLRDTPAPAHAVAATRGRGTVRTVLTLDVFSDVICPWCYLGHRRLGEALARLGRDANGITLRWRAFQLDPRADDRPRDLTKALEAKYGPGSFEVMARRLAPLGEEVGIEYRFEQALRVGTFDAHRLIQWTQATDPGRTDVLVDHLFHAYFTEGANVADHPTLGRIAGQCGLDTDSVGDLLASRAFADEVMADRAEALESGISGVPAVVYNGATIIPGAQDTETMELILKRLHAKVG
jgi:predicted DsbA family dithiol-disulfide isomerase